MQLVIYVHAMLVIVADNIALAAVTSIEMWYVRFRLRCLTSTQVGISSGGPKIPFRGGRIDATEANTPGVPEPQQDLASHVASFSRQGFTQEEMIGLVACGHSFGGVQHTAFPDTVDASSDPHNTDGNAPFDSTLAAFDNNVSVVYVHHPFLRVSYAS